MKVAIIGCGKSGRAAEELFKIDNVEQIDKFDDKDNSLPNISEYSGGYDITLVSPGIDRSKYSNLPENVTSEIETAYKHMRKDAHIIGITGTNGKSTTTHLTAQIINRAGIKAAACGNIGYPFAEAVLDKDTKVFVIELSSFQIELLNEFNIEAGCIINVTQDHLDRYGVMDKYYEAKLKMLDFIGKDGLFVANTDNIIQERAKKYNFELKTIDDNFEKYPVLEGSILKFENFYVDTKEYGLFGHHNLINLAFSLQLADKICHFSGDVTSLIKGLSGMPHRTEFVAEINGVKWINDSKATNVDSVYTALLSMKKPSVLLLGGRDKKSDYKPLAELINKNVSEVCYFGEAGDLIKGQLSSLLNGVAESSYKSLELCVSDLSKRVKSGSTVILSPACTSFDEFKSYEDRGIKFGEYVKKYAGASVK